MPSLHRRGSVKNSILWMLVAANVSGCLLDATEEKRKGGLGELCESSADCEEREYCSVNANKSSVVSNQCTGSCQDDDDCVFKLISATGTRCLTSKTCVRLCTVNSDCPSGTACNEYQWCERSTSVPKRRCVGVPLGCNAIGQDEQSCKATPGCYVSPACVGEAARCEEQSDCYASGCSHDVGVQGCYGKPSACSLHMPGIICSSSVGCHRGETCRGSAEACEDLSELACDRQPGCRLE